MITVLILFVVLWLVPGGESTGCDTWRSVEVVFP
jgi:hypothetical protein